MTEPRADIKADVQKNHVVKMGAQRVTETVIPADSYSSTSAVKAKFYIQVDSDVAFVLGTKEALRQFPIASVTDVLTCTINGESVSEQVADIIHPLACYGNSPQDRTKSWSTTAAQPDQYQAYADWNTEGSARNPFSYFGENAGEISRGAFPYTTVSPTSLRYEVTEPLFLSPFFSGVGSQTEGFVNVNQMNITFRFKDLSRAWSADGTTGTTYTVSFWKAPELSVSYLTPDMLQPIPAVQTLPYHKNQIYKKNMSALTANSTVQQFTDSIKLNQVPSRVYLFAKHSAGTESAFTTDTYLGIDNASITFNNQNSLLSSASSSDLFEISRRNGLNVSYPEWSKYRGAVLCVDFSKDIGLPDSLAPGTISQCSLQANVTFKNLSQSTRTCDFYMVVCLNGTFTLSESQARASLGNLTESIVLATKEKGDQITHIDYQLIHGGGFMTDFFNVLKKVGKTAVNVAPAVASVVAPELVPLTQAAKQLAGGSYSGGRLARSGVKRR
jgi:hypothetical protein